jgi:plastocyanin
MSKKKKRRGAQPKQAEQPAPSSEGAGDAPPDDGERSERRAQQIRKWEQRKKQRERGKRSLAPVYWGAGVVAVIALAVLGGVVLLGGGDGDKASSAPEATPDARVEGLPIDQTVTVNLNDDGQEVNPRFEPNRISGVAGEVIEIITPNIGSVAHNLRVAGLDGEYDTRDDWITDPDTVFPDEEGRVVVKIDEPGSYPFKCDFHPQQTGMLILR